MLRMILLSVVVAISSAATVSWFQIGGSVSAAGAVHTADFGEITVSADPVPLGSRGHGYVEYRVVVTNRASQNSHSVRVTVPASSYRGTGGLDEVSRSMTVQPSSSVAVSLFVPIMEIYGSGMAVTIDGARRSQAVQLDVVAPGENRPCVFISQGAQKKQFESVATSARLVKTPSGSLTASPPQFASFPSAVPAIEWSPNWLGYSSFDGIVITEDEMRGVPAEVSTALSRFAECGGILVILGNWEIPEAWRLREKKPALLPTYCEAGV